jgi:hypothetical protein
MAGLSHRSRARRAVLAAALLLPGVPAAARAQGDARPLAATRVAAQLGAGLVAMPVGFVLGGKATEIAAERWFGVPDPRASLVALVGGWVGAGLATAAGPARVGARGPGSGRYLAAVGGAAVGGAASLLLVRLNDRTGDGPRPPCRLRCALAAAAVFTLPSIGATVAYNASRRAAR